MRRKSIFLRALSADAGHGPVFQHPQQLGLQGEAQSRNFVEQQRAGVRQFDMTGLGRPCVSKSALLMSEELGLDQVLWQSRAIDADKRLLARGPSSTMARATSSLPVPLSPRIRTVLVLSATRVIAS